MTEQSDVTGPLLRALREFPNLIVLRIHCGKVKVRGGWMQQNETGTADICVIHGPYSMFIETKTDSGRLKPEQHAMHERCVRQNVRYRIARTWREGVGHVQEWLEELK